MCRWKKVENRSIFGDDVDKKFAAYFLDHPVYNTQHTCNLSCLTPIILFCIITDGPRLKVLRQCPLLKFQTRTQPSLPPDISLQTERNLYLTFLILYYLRHREVCDFDWSDNDSAFTATTTTQYIQYRRQDDEWRISYVRLSIYSVSQKKSPPRVFWKFFPNGWEFLINFLHTYNAIIYTLDYEFLFKYFQLWQSYAILSATT